MNDDKIYEHPSYGMVSFARVSHGGKTRLFGSAIHSHQHTIRLRIAPGRRRHSLSMDWYGSAGFGDLIEVELSAAQFASLLTTMNVGEGVPCTIRHVGGKRMDDPPEVETEQEAVRVGFGEKLAGLIEKLKAAAKDAEARLAKPSLTKADGRAIKEALDLALREIACNLPFVVEQFQEAAERVTTTAKAEIEAFMVGAIQRAGFKALVGEALPALGDGKDGRGT